MPLADGDRNPRAISIALQPPLSSPAMDFRAFSAQLFGAAAVDSLQPGAAIHRNGRQSAFRIVPMPRFLVNSELPLLPNRSR
jgi:hypothetical protein